MSETLKNPSGGENNQNQWEDLKDLEMAPSQSVLVEQYGPRYVYEDENGHEENIKVNPFALAKPENMQTPEEMKVAAITLKELATNWKTDNQNTTRKQYVDGHESGWEDAQHVSDSDFVGQNLSKILQKQEQPNDKIHPNENVLLETYGPRYVYTDENGKENNLQLKPSVLLLNVKEPEAVMAAATVLNHTANNWKKENKNVSRTRYADGHEGGWENAQKLDNSTAFGRYVGKLLKNQ